MPFLNIGSQSTALPQYQAGTDFYRRLTAQHMQNRAALQRQTIQNVMQGAMHGFDTGISLTERERNRSWMSADREDRQAHANYLQEQGQQHAANMLEQQTENAKSQMRERLALEMNGSDWETFAGEVESAGGFQEWRQANESKWNEFQRREEMRRIQALQSQGMVPWGQSGIRPMAGGAGGTGGGLVPRYGGYSGGASAASVTDSELVNAAPAQLQQEWGKVQQEKYALQNENMLDANKPEYWDTLQQIQEHENNLRQQMRQYWAQNREPTFQERIGAETQYDRSTGISHGIDRNGRITSDFDSRVDPAIGIPPEIDYSQPDGGPKFQQWLQRGRLVQQARISIGRFTANDGSEWFLGDGGKLTKISESAAGTASASEGIKTFKDILDITIKRLGETVEGGKKAPTRDDLMATIDLLRGQDIGSGPNRMFMAPRRQPGMLEIIQGLGQGLSPSSPGPQAQQQSPTGPASQPTSQPTSQPAHQFGSPAPGWRRWGAESPATAKDKHELPVDYSDPDRGPERFRVERFHRLTEGKAHPGMVGYDEVVKYYIDRAVDVATQNRYAQDNETLRRIAIDLMVQDGWDLTGE